MFGKPVLLFDNRLTDAAAVASGTAAGDFDVSYLSDMRPYTWWQADALPATATVASGAPVTADYWLVWGHDLFTQGATIELRGSTDNFAASDVLIDTFAPTADAPFLRTFAQVTYNDWRIQITGPGAAPSLAIVAFGDKFEFPRYLKRGFDPIGRKSKGTMNKSHNGQPLGTVIKYREWSETLSFNNVGIDFVRQFEVVYASHLDSTPFVFAWDPTDHVDEFYLCDPLDRFSAPHTGGLFARLRFKLTGLA